MLAYIFPGQGSQYAGMGRDLAENFAAAREVFAEADEALGLALTRLCFEGPAEELQLTENTQPAILAVSVAALRALAAAGFRGPDFVAGHSLGEYSALVAAGSLPLAVALRIVRARGRYMQEAVPVGAGAMAAVIGLPLDVVREVCEQVSDRGVCSPANINSPGQVVIAGAVAAVDQALALLKERGARRAIKLNVSAPFHCALMRPAQERLAADLEKIAFADLRHAPLVTNVDAAVIRTGAEARDALVRQVSSPVRWAEAVELMLRSGVTTFVEIGPGKVLSGLVRQISREALCLNVEDAAGVRAAVDGRAAHRA